MSASGEPQKTYFVKYAHVSILRGIFVFLYIYIYKYFGLKENWNYALLSCEIIYDFPPKVYPSI